MPSLASKLSIALKFLNTQGDCSICWMTNCLNKQRERENEINEPVKMPHIETGIVNMKPRSLLWKTCEYVKPNIMWFSDIGSVITKVVVYSTLIAPIAWNG